MKQPVSKFSHKPLHRFLTFLRQRASSNTFGISESLVQYIWNIRESCPIHLETDNVNGTK